MDILLLRVTACYLWILAGILSHSKVGDISALASIMFLVAMMHEFDRKQNH